MEMVMKIKAEKRIHTGRRGCQKLQAQGYYPAVLYGYGKQSQSIQIAKATLDVFMRQHPVKTQLFSIEVENKSQDVLVKDIKRSTTNNKIQHVDFFQVSKNTELQVAVPVRFLHEEASPGVIASGVVDHVLTEVNVKVLPKNLPEAVDVDLSHLEIGQSIHLSEIKLPKGCTLQKAITEENDPLVVSIHAPKVVEEPSAEVVDETKTVDVEATSKVEEE